MRGHCGERSVTGQNADVPGLVAMAQHHLAAGQMEQAIDALRQAVALSPRDINLRTVRNWGKSPGDQAA
jgi:hypothetical protein